MIDSIGCGILGDLDRHQHRITIAHQPLAAHLAAPLVDMLTGDIVTASNTGDGLAVHIDLTQNRKLLLDRPAPATLNPRHHPIAHEISAACDTDTNNGVD